MIIKATRQALKPITIDPGINGIVVVDPPRNRSAIIYESVSILPYSPRKKSANVIEEYSILYPATISASASGRSKGARFVSARIEIKKIPASGRRGALSHDVVCARIISTRLRELTSRRIARK